MCGDLHTACADVAPRATFAFRGKKSHKLFELAGLRARGPKKFPKSVIKSVMRFWLTDFLTSAVFSFALETYWLCHAKSNLAVLQA